MLVDEKHQGLLLSRGTSDEKDAQLKVLTTKVRMKINVSPATRYTLRRNAASIMKFQLIFLMYMVQLNNV